MANARRHPHRNPRQLLCRTRARRWSGWSQQPTLGERNAPRSRSAPPIWCARCAASSDPRLMEVFLSAYGLSTKEGVALMCLAEALLRVPDTETMDDLIRDKIAPQDWSAHSGGSASIFVNASTWALMLTGRVLDEGEGGIERHAARAWCAGSASRSSARRSRRRCARWASSSCSAAPSPRRCKRGQPMTAQGLSLFLRHAGRGGAHRGRRAALSRAYSGRDLVAGQRLATGADIRVNPGISVKLSALHPRYEVAQRETMLPVMAERLLSLALAARACPHGAQHRRRGGRPARPVARRDRARCWPIRELAGWDGFGVVVQAYGPRAAFVIDWLHALAQKLDRAIMVRLVKGAYWDTEIKRAQTLGLSGYPVFTRKANTDVSYIACARKLLSMTDRIYPQFATHNAHTVAAILAMAAGPRQLSSSSACTAWARRCTRRCARRRARAAASMRRSARIPTCWPIWCAACWRTAPTRPSSTS